MGDRAKRRYVGQTARQHASTHNLSQTIHTKHNEKCADDTTLCCIFVSTEPAALSWYLKMRMEKRSADVMKHQTGATYGSRRKETLRGTSQRLNTCTKHEMVYEQQNHGCKNEYTTPQPVRLQKSPHHIDNGRCSKDRPRDLGCRLKMC
jgi:hypothetical protein